MLKARSFEARINLPDWKTGLNNNYKQHDLIVNRNMHATASLLILAVTICSNKNVLKFNVQY
jgi:hypothetical protein